MPLVSWNDSYSVKVQKFDEQHKVLFNLLNELHEAMQQGKGRTKVAEVLGALVRYTQQHFGAEEAAMRVGAYPQYLEHKQEHDGFAGKVLTFQSEYDKGNALLSVELMGFLRDWLTGHILKSDRMYAPYLKP